MSRPFLPVPEGTPPLPQGLDPQRERQLHSIARTVSAGGFDVANMTWQNIEAAYRELRRKGPRGKMHRIIV